MDLLRLVQCFAVLAAVACYQQNHGRPVGSRERKLVARMGEETNFVDFPDADRIVSLPLGLGPGASAGVRTHYEPAELQGLSAQETWNWWQRRRMQESVLKSAVGSVEDLRPHFEQYRQFAVLDEAQVLNTHKNFFQALGEGDLTLMQALWMDAPHVLCSTGTAVKHHPEATNFVGGYANVVNYFAKQTPTKLDYRLRDVNLMFHGECAVVTCLVDCLRPLPGTRSVLSAGAAAALSSSRKPLQTQYATSIFQRAVASDRYTLVSHVSTLFLAAVAPEARSKTHALLRETYSDPTRVKPKKKPTGLAMEQLNKLFGGGGFTAGSDDDDDDDEEEKGGGRRIVINNVEYEIAESDGADEDEDEEEEEVVVIRSDGAEPKGKKAPRGGEEDTRQQRMTRLRDTLQQTLSRLSGQRGGVVIIGEEEGMRASKVYEGAEGNKGRRRDDEDDSEDEEEAQEAMKELAARTLDALHWLHLRDRLPLREKKVLSSDVIRCLSVGEFSQSEVAYALLIMGACPGDSALQMPMDPAPRLAQVSADDMNDFEDFCRRYAQNTLL